MAERSATETAWFFGRDATAARRGRADGAGLAASQRQRGGGGIRRESGGVLELRLRTTPFYTNELLSKNSLSK